MPRTTSAGRRQHQRQWILVAGAITTASTRRSRTTILGLQQLLQVGLLLAAAAAAAWNPSPPLQRRRRVSPTRTRMATTSTTTTTPQKQQQQLGSFEELSDVLIPSERPVRLLDWSNMGAIDFEDAWNIQRQLLQEQLDAGESTIMDTVIFLQHEPVYTLGTASDPNLILNNCQNQDDAGGGKIPKTVRMDRGGEVTYHGPGQLTVYPILNLKQRYKMDIHWYVRALEEVVIRALRDCGGGGIDAYREPDVTGVWVQDVKVAAVGIKCRRWITQHGFAINVEHSSLEHFNGIVPCGLHDRQVGCINQFMKNNDNDHTISVSEMAKHVKNALEDVFRIQLVHDDENVHPSSFIEA